MNPSAPKYAAMPAPQGSVASPCIDICRIGGDGYCEGCLRTMEEISAWRDASDDEKRAVLARLEGREKKTAG